MSDPPSGTTAELQALREETGKRQDTQNQIVSYTLLFAASMLTLGLGDHPYHAALLVYPVVSFFFAVGFTYNALMLIEIGNYIRTAERTIPGLGWAAYLKDRYRRIERFETGSVLGLFAGTQLIALLLHASLNVALTRTEAVVNVAAWAALAATVWVILYAKRYHARVLRESGGASPG
jgi:positive regulator of sigma E activity